MKIAATALAVVGLSALLSACSTSDALTPQVDVGGGLRPSTPVTQAEADQLVGNTGQTAYATDGASVYRTEEVRPPQNTLEAQAQALQAGQLSPSASDPQSSAPLAPSVAAPPLSAAAPPPSAPAIETAAAPPSAASGTIRFLPIIGAPVQSVTPLSRQLGAQARASGLAIRASADTGTDHILKMEKPLPSSMSGTSSTTAGRACIGFRGRKRSPRPARRPGLRSRHRPWKPSPRRQSTSMWHGSWHNRAEPTGHRLFIKNMAAPETLLHSHCATVKGAHPASQRADRNEGFRRQLEPATC